MRKLGWILACLILGVGSVASADTQGPAGLLNQVSLRLNAEQWVSTKTALVTIGINAGVNDAALEKIQEDVLKKLDQLSNKGEWHITSFDRNLDQSGLEHVSMSAQARLPSAALPSLREKTKSMSKPGETYTLDNLEFTPSEAELRDANVALRTDVYQQAREELERVNKAYPEQKYYVHEINFLTALPIAMPQNGMMMAMKVAAPAAATLAVGNKLVLNATVVFAALPPDTGLIKSIR